MENIGESLQDLMAIDIRIQKSLNTVLWFLFQ